ncbi:glycosaminoglycan xylosylkinase-like [Clytia hemisphaerica]|uniref:glycosaminoglycan xylosylkinase-like n=1 Tax=Clytia hemisphaerica TaxID=252671 RepID=UPI0034D5D3F3
MKWKQRFSLIVVSVFVLCLLHFNSKQNTWQNTKRSTDSVATEEKIHPWIIWKEMPEARAITSISDLQVDMILNAMAKTKILQAKVGVKGTQLKAQFVLDGPPLKKQEVVFKPKRYSRDKILGGTPYEGYDRHNGEIAAFHLDRILGFNRAPPVVGRLVNLREEVINVAQTSLLDTFWRDNSNNICFFGKCMYCKREESACGKGEIMEASLTLWLPKHVKLYKMRHPWQRTYRKNRKAKWEIDSNYCDNVITKPPYDQGPRLLDLMDTSIFDFLIGNADRHHYEFTRNKDTSMVIHLDNGKSFGNPNHDELSILAPLMQCCTLRHQTYLVISSYITDEQTEISLSQTLEKKLASDPIYPVLTKDHLLAIDRRLETILTQMKKCFEKKGKENVLV